ncbi:DUF4238 domain-containing protein [Variovorax paradoxus]|uniref:DUF4238 domain-containing protein n=1 Tax=Variovorax paradoxus TaxID=34073 RepID=A0A5Q0M6J0_VARPD|nr:DUF4238 domain-containing protein [Variovorax paradoxus]QFZ84062.1 DUF4238 domain-containing protein [Variovorax paradoxus]
MAGKRHHFIPQFLQRGFGSPENASNAWVFRKDRPAFNTSIQNIALEGQFYTHDGDRSVDDAITDDEGALAAFVTDLRAAANGTNVDSQQAAKLVAHMLVRTRHVRENFERMTGDLVNGVYNAMSDPTKLAAVLTAHIQDDANLTRILKQILTVAAGDQFPLKELSRHLDQALTPAMLQRARAELPAYFKANADEQARALQTEGKLTQGLLKGAMKSGHLKALKRVATSSEREEAFAKLTFRIRKYPGGNIILGDSAAVHAVAGERRVAPLNDATVPMVGVLLPLDTETCLIGELNGRCEVFETAESVRQAIAGCSLEFFVASVDTPENRALVSNVAKDSYLLDAADVEEILGDLGLV